MERVVVKIQPYHAGDQNGKAILWVVDGQCVRPLERSLDAPEADDLDGAYPYQTADGQFAGLVIEDFTEVEPDVEGIRTLRLPHVSYPEAGLRDVHPAEVIAWAYSHQDRVEHLPARYG